MGLVMLVLSVPSSPLLPALYLTLLAAVSHRGTREKAWFIFLLRFALFFGCGAQVHSCVEAVLGQP